MSSFHILLAIIAAFTQRSIASFGHVHTIGAIPVAEPVPVIGAAPIVAASVPVVVAPPAPVVAAAPVIVQEPEHLQPKAEIHNRVSSFHKETGHLSDTSMLLPAKARRLSAKKARMHKKAHKKN